MRTTPRKIIFDGEFEAKLIALACTEPPDGRVRWTVRLLGEILVEMRIVDKVSAMTVPRALKKRTSTSLVQILVNSPRA